MAATQWIPQFASRRSPPWAGHAQRPALLGEQAGWYRDGGTSSASPPTTPQEAIKASEKSRQRFTVMAVASGKRRDR